MCLGVVVHTYNHSIQVLGTGGVMFDADLDYIALWQDPISKQTSLVLTGDKFSFTSKTKCNFTCADLKADIFVSSETMYI